MVNNINETNAGVFVAIVAAGAGTRFGAAMPKQFLPLRGKPVLMHTIEAFKSALPDCKIFLMLSADGKTIWNDLCEKHNFISPEVVEGGRTRSETVALALKAISKAGALPHSVIMIHDGARPLVSKGLLHALYRAVAIDGHRIAVPALTPTDSLEQLADGILRPVNRNDYICVQTPQTFLANTVFSAFDKASTDPSADLDSTDDVTVVARYEGDNIHAVPGDRNNIKITHPSDIYIAEVLIEHPYPYQPQ